VLATSLILREEHKLRVFENRVLRVIIGPRREKEAGGWKKNCTVRSFVTYTLHRILLG
jgi:hypothetical protein